MSSTREVKVFYFQSDEDIQSYILNLKNIRQDENSIEYRGNHIQLRDVLKDDSSGCILGRLCKVREIEKPKVGKFNDTKEEYLQKDIIESSNFIYNPKTLKVIMQNNTHVSANPNSLLSRLLTKTHEQGLSSGFGIQAVIRDDVLEEIIKGRGSITRIKVKTTKEGANIIAKETGDDVEMGDNFLDSASYTERELIYKMSLGSVNKSLIQKFKDWFDSGKLIDAAFSIDGNRSPIKLSEFAKYELLNVELDNGSFDTLDFQNKLLTLVLNES